MVTISSSSHRTINSPSSLHSLNSPTNPLALQEVYGRLEEPDGLQGLVRLRQGGPRPEDQRLAAEKAGNWSEALTLYEQALQHSGSSGAGGSGSTGTGAGGTSAAAVLADGPQGDAGLGAQQRGCLECLLHIGHLQGLLAQVEGLAAGAGDKSAAQLAALGAAASWRLGQWELVEGYVEAANSGFAGLDMDARWEVSGWCAVVRHMQLGAVLLPPWLPCFRPLAAAGITGILSCTLPSIVIFLATDHAAYPTAAPYPVCTPLTEAVLSFCTVLCVPCVHQTTRCLAPSLRLRRCALRGCCGLWPVSTWLSWVWAWRLRAVR
jgi:hypothetical protein